MTRSVRPRIEEDSNASRRLKDDLRAWKVLSDLPVPHDVTDGLERLRRNTAMKAPAGPSFGTRASYGIAVGVGVLGLVAALRWAGHARPVVPLEAAQLLTVTVPEPLAPPSAPAPANVDNDPVVVAPAPSASGTSGARGNDRASMLVEEARSLNRIRLTLRQDPAAALRLASLAHERFRRGVLFEEREALAIVALARTGKSEAAHKRGEAFLARFPEGPHAELVRREVMR